MARQDSIPDLIPVRMLNEYTYCPRLAYLMWVQGEWADNVETLEGKHAHRRVDQEEGPRAKLHHRSVQLSSSELGLTAVMDLIERQGGRARPVDYKRGAKPAVEGGAWEPERVQLCAQGLLLREHGYTSNEGVLYYVASKQRVRIRFTEALVQRTLQLAADMREQFRSGSPDSIPPPLRDSPKCPRCSLVSICLPDEVNFLRQGGKVRRLTVTDPATYPLVVQEPGASVRLDGERLIVAKQRREIGTARLAETSHVVLMGGASCTGPALRICLQRQIPIVHTSGTGWLVGITHGALHKNVELRIEQFAAARDVGRSIGVARRLVASKIRNSRALLRRNGHPPQWVLKELNGYARVAAQCIDDETLLGIEGSAASLYFSHFRTMLKVHDFPDFDFAQRTKRPPTDPVNALLSYAYTLLTKDWVVALYSVGFDYLLGLYHRPRYGKPALALDMMEPFRSLVADSVVVTAINNGEIGGDDFYSREGAVLLKPVARKRFVGTYERRLALQVKHPIFGYQVTYRRLFELEARLLARHLLGEIPSYDPYETR